MKFESVSQDGDYLQGLGSRNWEGSLWDISGTSNILFLDLDQSFSSSTDILDWISLCCGGPFCVLRDVQQHPWLLPTRCQGHTQSRNDQKCLQILPNDAWEAKLLPVENR